MFACNLIPLDSIVGGFILGWRSGRDSVIEADTKSPMNYTRSCEHVAQWSCDILGPKWPLLAWHFRFFFYVLHSLQRTSPISGQ